MAALIGVGVGPGDPELLTLKAFRLIKDADVVCYLTNAQGESQAKDIASLAFDAQSSEQQKIQQHIAIEMPMDKERVRANAAYDQATKQIIECLDDQKNVVFLCEGDPLFFGSFAYVLERIQVLSVSEKKAYDCQVVPGISSVNASASALVLPLTKQSESFAVVSGRHDEAFLINTLNNKDTVVIMKAGQSRPRILSALEKTGRLQQANYLEYIGRENQKIVRDVSELANEVGPYFSLFVVVNR
jgi:precorrin-2/cobalt-factor-2 C20-methyltransferase